MSSMPSKPPALVSAQGAVLGPAGHSKTLAEALRVPEAAEVEFNPPKADWMPKPAEFD
jgi:hypothetical protein